MSREEDEKAGGRAFAVLMLSFLVSMATWYIAVALISTYSDVDQRLATGIAIASFVITSALLSSVRSK